MQKTFKDVWVQVDEDTKTRKRSLCIGGLTVTDWQGDEGEKTIYSITHVETGKAVVEPSDTLTSKLVAEELLERLLPVCDWSVIPTDLGKPERMILRSRIAKIFQATINDAELQKRAEEDRKQQEQNELEFIEETRQGLLKELENAATDSETGYWQHQLDTLPTKGWINEGGYCWYHCEQGGWTCDCK